MILIFHSWVHLHLKTPGKCRSRPFGGRLEPPILMNTRSQLMMAPHLDIRTVIQLSQNSSSLSRPHVFFVPPDVVKKG